jgi:uncharacterized delta-60 repeat protein
MKPVPFSLFLLTAVTHFSSLSAAVEVDPTFNVDVDGTVHAIALLPNGNVLVGGEFNQVNHTSRANLTLLNANGSVSSDFNIEVDGAVFSVAAAGGGAAYVGGAFNVPSRHLLRIAADGQVETLAVGSSTSSRIKCLAVGPGQAVTFGGPFRRLDGEAANYVAKLSGAGAVDRSFSSALLPSLAIEAGADAIAVQVDGKVLVGGNFNTLDGSARLVRLNLDGSIDPDFSGNHGPMLYPKAIVVLGDGRILVAGVASASGDGFVRRLNADGSVDATFNAPGFGGSVEAIALAKDGGIIVGGNFSEKLMCLRADGSRNADWNVTADGVVKTLATQSDGAVLVGGGFSVLGGVPRKGIARLNVKPSSQQAFATATNGRFIGRLSGEEGGVYEIESSNDLRTWSSAGSVVAGASGIDVSDENPSARAHRFFRARRVD